MYTLHHLELREHLDKAHYMSIKETKDGINCQCLICGDLNSTTERHNTHLEKFHFSLGDRKRTSSIRADGNSLNSELRGRVRQVGMESISNVMSVETEDGMC